MSIQQAINFIAKVDEDNDFRKSCYVCKSKTELLTYVGSHGFSFTSDEIADAFNTLIFKCQTYEQHENVRHLQNWFSLFK